MCSFQLITAFWNRDGATSPPECRHSASPSASCLSGDPLVLVGSAHKVQVESSELGFKCTGLLRIITQRERTSIVRPSRQGSPGVSFYQRASSCCFLGRILSLPIVEMNQRLHPKGVTGVWPFNSHFSFRMVISLKTFMSWVLCSDI